MLLRAGACVFFRRWWRRPVSVYTLFSRLAYARLAFASFTVTAARVLYYYGRRRNYFFFQIDTLPPPAKRTVPVKHGLTIAKNLNANRKNGPRRTAGSGGQQPAFDFYRNHASRRKTSFRNRSNELYVQHTVFTTERYYRLDGNINVVRFV